MAGEPRLEGVEIWCVDLAACAAALSHLEATAPRLPPAPPKSGPSERAAHIALRLLIERAFGPAWRGIPFTTSASGRPSLAGLDGDFSLAHSGGCALIGIAGRGRIGVDVEGRRPLQMAQWRRQRIEEAGQLLAPGQPLPDEPEAKFLQAWTRLEAFAKAGGQGIGAMLSAVGRPAAGSVGEGLGDVIAAAPPLTVHDLALDQPLFAAVAIAPHHPAPTLRELPASADALERLVVGKGEQR